MVVEMGYVLGQRVFEVAAAEDQHPVEQFAADSVDPAFSDGVDQVVNYTQSPRSV